ncbi:MAG TPA: hypothetical protein VGG39_35170 [Polyangiaceae bacterium]|jgi:hypothetical protein
MLMTVIAIFGAVSGSISLAWLIRNWAYDRVDLRLTAMAAMRVPAQPGRLRPPLVSQIEPDDVLAITLANHGRRDVHVQSLGGELSDGSEFVFRDPTGLPCALKEGQRQTFEYDLEVFGRENEWVTALFAYDGLGRKWRLGHPDFLRLQAQAKETLGKRKVDEGAVGVEWERRRAEFGKRVNEGK